MAEKYTFCRICEPCCPLVAVTDDSGEVRELKADKGHPCGGVPCHKGLLYLDIHRDPDRVNWPQKRLNLRQEERGQFVEVDWDTALDEIADKLKTIQAKYGKDSVAFYLGNPAAFHTAGFSMAGRFQDAIETRMRFSAATQDASNKLVGAAKIYGSTSSFPVVDITNTDFLLCIGSNPKVSRWTVCSFPNDGGKELKAIKKRGGKVLFVNPRKTESSSGKTGETLQIRPGTDVYFLAALLLELRELGGYDRQLIARLGRNLGLLDQFIERYPAHLVAPITGIEEEVIRQVAREFLASRSAAAYISTGVNQSRQGLLSYLLVEMINFLTGNLGRKGGTHKPNNLFNDYPPATVSHETLMTSIGEFEIPKPMGDAVLPSALIPDLMASGEIKALIIQGGNPLLSVGGEGAFREAAKNLELMVSIDIYRSSTGELCDYVLPAVDWLERADINHFGASGQPLPYVQYTPRVTEPAAGRRSDWWILSALLQKLSLPSDLDNPGCQDDGGDTLELMLRSGGVDIGQLKKSAHQTKVLGEADRKAFFEACLQHFDGKIDCFPESFIKWGLLERCEKIFAELSCEDVSALKLIPLRTPYMHNSWFANLPRFSKGQFGVNPLHMSLPDAEARSLADEDQVVITSRWGKLETSVVIDERLPEGTVAMSHGGGHKNAFGMQQAVKRQSQNYNALAPVGLDAVEPLSYMAWLSAIPVSVSLKDTALSDSDSQSG
jgi:anaerobic selenocysteine-containing dehydrogenase